jgi:hypothetical protein
VGVSTAIVHLIVTLLVPPVCLVLQVVQLLATLFIILLLYIHLILVLSSVPFGLITVNSSESPHLDSLIHP